MCVEMPTIVEHRMAITINAMIVITLQNSSFDHKENNPIAIYRKYDNQCLRHTDQIQNENIPCPVYNIFTLISANIFRLVTTP